MPRKPSGQTAEKPKVIHSTLNIRVELTPAQCDYLECIAKQLRAPTENVLVALAFSRLEMEEGSGEDRVGQFTQHLRDFVDMRKVPSGDPDISAWASCGRHPTKT